MPFLIVLLLLVSTIASAAPARRASDRVERAVAVKPTMRAAGFRHEVDLRSSPEFDNAPRAQRVERPSSPPRELVLHPALFTPYDRYMGTVKRVIANVDGNGGDMLLACQLMREGYSFRYVMTDPYRAELPEVTSAKRAGDCKSKALWLLDHLGDPGALYVIGKAHRRSKSSHAWVYWKSEGRWWILDPTNRANPIAAESVARDRYVPYYSFGKAGAFRHPATQIFLADTEEAIPAVAARAPAGKRLVKR